MAGIPRHERARRGFTLVELVVVICILGIIAAVGAPKFVSLRKAAEKASVEATIASLSQALELYAVKQTASGQPLAAHNPFLDLVVRPSNYAGAFPDVDLDNCAPGEWAYQSGHAANSNWSVVCYRAREPLITAFGWGGVQWIIYEVRATTRPDGSIVTLGLVEYPPLHKW